MANETTYAYWLPDASNGRIERTTSANSLILIGANGSGKSRLGAWMEQQDGDGVHRVGVQRSLNFSEYVPLKSYAEAEGELFYGSTEKHYWQSDKGVRWEWGKGYTTKLLQDFDAALSALLAQFNIEIRQHFDACKKAENSGMPAPCTPATSLDNLYDVWNSVFPQRQIDMKDASFISIFKNNEVSIEYPATEMSDGERSVLYLAAQVLCIPKNKTIIVDEPEIHLHPSLMGRLWRTLERLRPDCLFVFITHDVQFASLHNNSDKIWVKSFNGQTWNWENIPNSDLPEQLLLELLGNRKNVLFVEGNAGSYDVQFYSKLYPDYYVVPCGGCTQVISNTKAFASTMGLHELKARGLIDRDFRSTEELNALEHNGIYCLNVAEVENLFLVESLLRIMASRFACGDIDGTVQKVKDYVMRQRFEKHLGKLVCQATVFSLKQQLAGIEINASDIDSIPNDFKEAIASLNPDEELEKQRACYTSALESNDYNMVLRLSNEKGIARSIGHFFGINDKEYCSKVTALILGEDGDNIVEALKPYIPAL